MCSIFQVKKKKQHYYIHNLIILSNNAFIIYQESSQELPILNGEKIEIEKFICEPEKLIQTAATLNRPMVFS